MQKTKELTENEKLLESYNEYIDRRRKFPMNLIEFCVGAALLIFCYHYIQNNPAEKSSLFSGMEVIVQKVKIMFNQQTEGKGGELQRKYQLERTYDEILTLAKETSCLSENEFKKANSAAKSIKEVNLDIFLEKERSYRSVANLYLNKIKNDCEKE